MKKWICLLFLPYLIYGCRQKEQIGPSLVGLFGPLVVVDSLKKSMDNPAFNAGDQVVFTATFQNDAQWVLKLKGRTTGAIKIFSGVSGSLGSFNALWNGAADGAPSFGIEIVDVELTFPNTPSDTMREVVHIAALKAVDPADVIISDFAVSKMYCVCGPTNPAGWPSDWPTTVNTNTAFVYPDGNNYMLMSGTPWSGSPISPYVDFLTISASTADVNYGKYFPLYADATKVYFNLMVYATPSPDTWLRVQFFEEGVAARYIDIRPDWSGWKLLSYNYSSLTPISDSYAVLKSNRVTAVQFILLGDATPPQSAFVSAVFDHAVFTNSAPYQP